jgi:fumarate reductase subunit C
MWEQFFSPTNRYCEMIRCARQQTQTDVDWFSEMELFISTEALLTSQRSVHDFFSFAQNHVVVWTHSQAFITTMTFYEFHQVVPFTTTHPQMHHVITIGCRSSFSVFASGYAPAIAACDFLLCFFVKSKVPSVSLHCYKSTNNTLPVSAPALSHFVGQATLAKLELCNVDLDANFGRALSLRGTSISNFHLTLECCSAHCSAGGGEELDVLIHGLQSIRGSLEVNGCWIDSHIIAATLSGDNCHLKRLKLTAASNHNSNSSGGGGGRPIIKMDPISRSLHANKTGLVELAFGCMPISNRDLAVLCDALASHATVTTLDLSQAQPTMSTQESMTFWLQTIVQLLKANNVLHNVKLSKHLMTAMTDEDIYCYREEIVPRLEMNRFGSRLQAIKAVPDTDFRAKLLARELALPSVRHSPDLICMLISENAQLVASYRCSRKRNRHRADAHD